MALPKNRPNPNVDGDRQRLGFSGKKGFWGWSNPLYADIN
ncbi:hypothetical protein AC519_3790 [Pseudomonas savastanoi]|nr:hypothetical protein AC519_3790 [Pseudomonas savastanoi]